MGENQKNMLLLFTVKKDIVKKVLESGAKKVIISSPPFSILKIANDIKNG